MPRTTTSEPRGTLRQQRKDRVQPITGEKSDREEFQSFCQDLSMYRPGEGMLA